MKIFGDKHKSVFSIRGHHFSPTPERSFLSLSLFVTRSLSLLFPFIRAIIALQFGRRAPPSSLCSFRMLVVSVDSFVVNSSSGIYLVLVFFCKEARGATLFRDENEQGGPIFEIGQ